MKINSYKALLVTLLSLFIILIAYVFFYYKSDFRFGNIEKGKYKGSYQETSSNEIYKSLSDYYSMTSLGNYKEGVNERWPKTGEKLEFDINVDDITLRVEETTKNKGDEFIVNYEYYIDGRTEKFLQPNILVKMRFRNEESLGLNPSQKKEIQVAASYRMTFSQEIDKKTFDKLTEIKNKHKNSDKKDVSIKCIFSSEVRFTRPEIRKDWTNDGYHDSEIYSILPSNSELSYFGENLGYWAGIVFTDKHYAPWLNMKFSSDPECSDFKTYGSNAYLSFIKNENYSWEEFRSKTGGCLKKFSSNFPYPNLSDFKVASVDIPIVIYEIENISLISKIGAVGRSGYNK